VRIYTRKLRGLPGKLDEVLAVVIILSPISSVCGIGYRARLVECRALLIGYRALLVEHGALLVEYRALLVEHRDLLIGISSVCGTIENGILT